MAVRVKTGNSTWANVSKIRVKISNTSAPYWADVIVGRIKDTANSWKNFFLSALTPVIQTKVTISSSGGTNAGSTIMNDVSAITLTSTRYHWADADGFTYIWQKSSDDSNWENIGTAQSTTNPASGSSSSSITKVLQASDFTYGQDMYFRFKSMATNSTYGTSASSESLSKLISYYGTPVPQSGSPSITGSTTVGNTAYGNIGVWTNSPTQYDYQWSYLNGSTVYPLTDTQSKSVSTKTLSGYSASINTSTSHGYRVGDYLSVSGMDNLFNGSRLITAVSGSSVSFTLPTQTSYSLTTSYTTNTSFVDYFGNAYKALQSMPTPSTYVSTNSYASGSFVQNGSSRYVALQTVPANTSISNTLYWQNIAPTNTSYWQLQSFSGTAASGSTLGYIYFDGTVYSSTSIALATPQTDAKTLTDLRGKVLYFIVRAYNPATTSPSSYTGARFIYGYPVISIGTIVPSSTSASIPYTQSYMTEYDIDIQYAGNSISGYPKTVTSPSTPISVTGLSAPRTYSYSISPKNGEGTYGLSVSGTFTTVLAAPVNTVAPLISPTTGTAGTTQYSVTNGTWNGSPDGYTYQWKYRDQANAWFNAPGTSDAATYTPPITFFTAGYLSPIKCTVTATNAGGSTAVDSSNTASVSPASRTVTYNANGGVGSDVVISYNYGATVTVASNTFTRSGYVFSNWNTASNGTGTSYSPSNTFVITSNTVLYAQWLQLPSTPTITYSSVTSSGFTVSWSSTSATSYDVSIYQSISGASVYSANGTTSTSRSVTGLSPNLGYTTTVTARNSAGSAVNSASQTTLKNAALTPSFGTNTSAVGGFSGSVTNYDTNYTWGISTSSGSVSWGTASGSSRPFTVTGLSGTNSATVTVTTARTNYENGSNTTTGSSRNAVLYTVTFDANGGSGSAAPTSRTQTAEGGSIVIATQGTLTRSGYTFGGFNTNTSGTGTNYAVGASYTPTSNVTLYAKWTLTPVASVTAIRGSTGGRTGTTFWNDPKSTMVYTFANVTSATARIQRSTNNSTWTSGATETLSISSNSATQTTNQPTGNTSASANYYYRAQVISLNGTTLPTPITSASIQNTVTPKSNISLYP